MIYREELLPYRKTSDNKKPDSKLLNLFSFQDIILCLSAFFSSRSIILKSLMPFGMSFFTSVYGVSDKQKAFLVGIASLAGYLTSQKGILSLSRTVTLLFLIFLSFVFKTDDKNRAFKMVFTGFIINTIMYIIFHMQFSPGGIVDYDIAMALVESVIFAASSYIFICGMPLYLENKKRKRLSGEEMIFIGLIISIIVSGMWDIAYKGFSIKNMVAFFVVLALGYIDGPAIGAAIGAVIGLISAMSNISMPVSLGIYAFCGLIAGVFKELGKIITCIAFVITAGLLGLYTAGIGGAETIFIEVLIPSIIFILIPKRYFERISLLINGDKMAVELQKSYIERVKDIMTLRLESISSTLSSLSGILEENMDNELSYKSEINGIVEKLVDRVCSGCDNKNLCWKKELYYTYDSFIELLRIIESSGRINSSFLPDDIKRKCIRPNELVKQANYIFEIFKLNNTWKKKLIKSRMIVSDQIKGVSEFIKTMIDEVATSIEFKNDIEEDIAVALDKKGLDFDDVFAVKNKRGGYEVTIYKKPCSGRQECSKEFSSVVSEVVNARMVRDGSQCRFNKDSSMCHFRLIEGESYDIITAAARIAKEEISGDNYSFGKAGEGRYMVAISDGMGSGVPAKMESSTTISLLEKFIEAGYERGAAIKAINSVLVFKSSSESFSTIDLALIDLYSGVGEFVKVGAAPAFIKSRDNISVIRSTSLPVGILDEIDIESEYVKLKNGDMVIMVSDGVVDAGGELKEKWIINFIREFDSVNPKDVAEAILERAKKLCDGNIIDDMTVLVSKLWKIM